MGNTNKKYVHGFETLDKEHAMTVLTLDKSGEITLNELMSMEEVQGVNLANTHSILALFHYDVSREGSINYHEFRRMVKHVRELEKETRRSKVKKQRSLRSIHRVTSQNKVEEALDRNKATGMFTSFSGPSCASCAKAPHSSDVESDDEDEAENTEREKQIEEKVVTRVIQDFRRMLLSQLGDPKSRDQYMGWLFHVADCERNNRVSMDELKVFLRALTADGVDPDRFTYKEGDRSHAAQRIMEEYDTNREGFLTKEEFMVLADAIVREYQRTFDPRVGSMNVNNYHITRTLGKGSQGVVKYAVHGQNRIPRAIKIVPRGNVSDMSRLDNEIKAMMMLNHPNVVRLVEVFEHGDHVYLVEELCGGGSLLEHILDAPLDELISRHYVRQLVDGLQYCHSTGVCHRDLRLENLLLDNTGLLKISDFGHAAIFKKGWDLFSTMLVGSLHNLSPEQVVGKVYSGEKIDVWSLGIIVYTLVVGHPPFVSTNLNEMFENIKACDVEFPSADEICLSEEVKDLVRKLLRADPDERPRCEDIKKHPWLSGPTRLPVFGRCELELDPTWATNPMEVLQIVTQIAKGKKGLRLLESDVVVQGMNWSIKGYYADYDLRLTIQLIHPSSGFDDEHETPFVRFQLEKGTFNDLRNLFKNLQSQIVRELVVRFGNGDKYHQRRASLTSPDPMRAESPSLSFRRDSLPDSNEGDEALAIHGVVSPTSPTVIVDRVVRPPSATDQLGDTMGPKTGSPVCLSPIPVVLSTSPPDVSGSVFRPTSVHPNGTDVTPTVNDSLTQLADALNAATTLDSGAENPVDEPKDYV